jgi:large subunit ribosomal protein L14
MINKGTFLKVSDNCGAKVVNCIRIAKSKKKSANRGESILVSIKRLRSSKRISIRVKKGEIYNAVILRTKIFTKNHFIDIGLTSFLENSVLLLNKQYKLVGTRVIGPISKQFKTGKFSRNVLLAAGVV